MSGFKKMVMTSAECLYKYKIAIVSIAVGGSAFVAVRNGDFSGNIKSFAGYLAGAALFEVTRLTYESIKEKRAASKQQDVESLPQVEIKLSVKNKR